MGKKRPVTIYVNDEDGQVLDDIKDLGMNYSPAVGRCLHTRKTLNQLKTDLERILDHGREPEKDGKR